MFREATYWNKVTYWNKGYIYSNWSQSSFTSFSLFKNVFSGLNPPFPFFTLCTSFPFFFRERVSCNLFWTGNYLCNWGWLWSFYSPASTSQILGLQEHHHAWLLWAGLPQWLTSWSRARFLSYTENSLRAALFSPFPNSSALLSSWNTWGIL